MLGFATVNALRAAREKRDVTTASYDATLTDCWGYLHFTNAGAKTLNLAPHSEVEWPVGAEITLRNGLSGDLTIQTSGAATVITPGDGALVLEPRMTAMLYCVDVDVWHLIGQTVAA